MAKLWSSIRIPPTQLCLAASALPRQLMAKWPQVADLEGVSGEMCFLSFLEFGRIPKADRKDQKYAFGHWGLIQDNN